MRVCIVCGKEVKRRWTGYNEPTCSPSCTSVYKRTLRQTLNPGRNLPTATTGAISELRVSIDLLMKGFEVFRAVSPSCSCDLAILTEGKLLRVEVRTGTIYRKVNGDLTYPPPGGHRVRADILATVYPDRIIYEPELPTPIQAATDTKPEAYALAWQIAQGHAQQPPKE